MWYSGLGVLPSARGMATNQITLQAGQTAPLLAATNFGLQLGKYTVIQEYDAVQQCWRAIGGSDNDANMHYFAADTVNYRLANLTGCAVGALLTNAGSGYTSAPTVTASAGGSIWRAIVGGAVATSVTIANGGANYTYPPNVQISAPPAGGIPATGYATLTNGVVSSVTITNQGAGYTSAPTITLVNDTREGQNGVSTGYGAAAVASLTGSGTITGLICIDHGKPVTSLPTLAFSGGGGSSAAATTIMCWSITAYAAGTAGTGLAGTNIRLSGEDAFPTTAAAYTNPSSQSQLVRTRNADILAPISGGGLTATGQVVYDGGIYTSVPTPIYIGAIYSSIATGTTPVATFSVGGQTDTSLLFPA